MQAHATPRAHDLLCLDPKALGCAKLRISRQRGGSGRTWPAHEAVPLSHFRQYEAQLRDASLAVNTGETWHCHTPSTRLVSLSPEAASMAWRSSSRPTRLDDDRLPVWDAKG